ncbi:MAG TPA: hypothetical protein VK590_04120 [Saprospiraceae bacterium]|nr:hypothetical protein [Saprospiraceae bacterium]
MKFNSLIIFLILFNIKTEIKCQVLLYDAIKIRGYFDETKNKFSNNNDSLKQYATILKAYLPMKYKLNESLNSEAVLVYLEKVSKNPFLSPYFPKLRNSTPNTSKFISNSISSLGGIKIPNDVLFGITDFIVKRTKQELSIAFFDKFRAILNDPKYVDLQTVFPQTYKCFNAIGNEIYQYQAYIQGIREAFKKDILALDRNLPSIIENHPVFWNKHKEWKSSLQGAFYIAGAISDKIHPGDILNDYPVEFLAPLNTNWKGAFQTLQLFSFSLRDSSNTKDNSYWVKPKLVKLLVTDEIAFKIYLGLIYEQAKSKENEIKFEIKNVSYPLVDILDNLAANFQRDYKDYSSFLSNLAEKTNKLNVLIKNNTITDNDSIAIQKYYDYYNATLNLFQHSTEISKLPYIKNFLPSLADTLKPYFDIAHTTADLVMDIKQKNFSSAVIDAAHIYDLVKTNQAKNDTINANSLKSVCYRNLKKSLINKIKHITATNDLEQIFNLTETEKKYDHNKELKLIIKKLKRAKNLADLKKQLNFVDSQVDLIDFEKKSEKLSKVVIATEILKSKNSFFKYGSFMAAMSIANSPEEVENAIEAIALPAGSSRIKRETSFNVSLNAYCGLFVGNEVIKVLDDKNKAFSRFNSFGLTAPIGFSISWGHRYLPFPFSEIGCFSKSSVGWSSSWFISLIDLGAVAAFRFTNPAAAEVPTIQLKDIFSPGIFLVIGYT